MHIVTTAIPVSTCQNRILNGNDDVIPKLILITNRMLNIPETKNIDNSETFQIILCFAAVIFFFLIRIYVIKYIATINNVIGTR